MDADQSIDGVGARIDSLIQSPADALVECYFDPVQPFAGSTFDDLGQNPPDEFTIDDLLAATLLDVRVPPNATRRILGPQRQELMRLLGQVPNDVPLWDASDQILTAAESLWTALTNLDGVGWVIAGKLMARKRPHLIPIADSVVVKSLNPPKGRLWIALRECLADDARRSRVESLRPAGIPEIVSTLRLLDVAIWMRGSDSNDARTCQQAVGLPVAPRPAKT